MKNRPIYSPLYFVACLMAMVTVSCAKKDVGIKPSANFTYIIMNPVPPARVEFSNHAADATSYVWDFGDNTTSTSKDPEHFYTKAGTYTVTLKATGANGTEQKQYQLTVGAKAMAIRGIYVTNVDQLPAEATFYAVVSYDGGGYALPDYLYSAANSSPNILAVWSGERFYSVPLQRTLTINLFYKVPGKPNPVPVGDDDAGTFAFKPSDLAVGNNAFPTEIRLENGSGAVKNKISLRVAWE